MRFYLAPLEGVTNYIFRNAYHRHFERLDKYFTPFISTNQQMSFSTRDMKEINPAHNAGLFVVPQILSNKADDFVKTAEAICAFGYDEINLNLGCPSNTVVSKNKGSGFLFHRDELNRFLETIYSKATMKISIKTRHGKYEHEEFYELVKIFNQYPLEELIIHPRITKDMYKNTPNLDVFGAVLGEIKAPVCYNGDIFSVADFERITSRFPSVDTVMLGRGLVGNPGLVGRIKHGHAPSLETVRSFHDELYEAYKEVMYGERNVLYKMKEMWSYMFDMFDVSDKFAKKIRKCEHLSDYDAIVDAVFGEGEMR
ncbi:MAG TPA: diguanylate cyclase [Clostridiales bacterium UBA8960]|nr:diguanylate cyclase [Clostridiales bacterium UBA8960]